MQGGAIRTRSTDVGQVSTKAGPGPTTLARWSSEGSTTLAASASVDTPPVVAGFDAPGSVDAPSVVAGIWVAISSAAPNGWSRRPSLRLQQVRVFALEPGNHVPVQAVCQSAHRLGICV